MDLFKLLSDIAGLGQNNRQYTAEAVFTGVSVDKDNNILNGTEGVPAFAYEIRYNARGRDITAWYMFPGGESPDPKKLAGTKMMVRYWEKDPTLFEKAE